MIALKAVNDTSVEGVRTSEPPLCHGGSMGVVRNGFPAGSVAVEWLVHCAIRWKGCFCILMG